MLFDIRSSGSRAIAVFQPVAEVGHLLRGIAHVDGALLVAFELGFHAVYGTEGRWW